MLLFILLLCIVIAGMSLTTYMATTTHSHRIIQCSLLGHCKEVYPIPYYRFLGLPSELAGSVYYSLMFIWFATYGFFPLLLSPFLNYCALAISCCAFIYSFYLMLVQIWLMKYRCLSCLTSTLFCASIFVGVILLMQGRLAEWLGSHVTGISFLFTLGLSFSFGATVIITLLLVRFLRDFRITAWEEDILHALSQARWIGFDCVLVAFLGLTIPLLEGGIYSPLAILEWIMLIVVFGATALLNLKVIPVLTHLSLTKQYVKVAKDLHTERRALFALSGIILVSWFFLFILGSVRETFFPLLSALVLYFYVIAIVIVGSQIIEYFFTHKYEGQANKKL